MPRTSVVAAAVALLLLFVYVRYFTVPNPDFQILQTTLAACTPELLAEKLPVVLTERVTDHAALLRTVFRFQYVHADAAEACPTTSTPSRARFAVVYLAEDVMEENAFVDIAHPRDSGDPVRIRLRLGTTVIIPPRWSYACSPGGARVVRLYDTFHAVARIFAPGTS